MKYNERDRRDNIILFAGIFAAILIPNIFLLFDAFKGSEINAENASQFGSFVGGYVGSILSFISILILAITLRHQRQSYYYEKFENKYFEMIKLHRENVKEIGGRKLFVLLLREFRLILLKIKEITREQNLKNHELFEISYTLLFYGTGPNSSRELKSALKNYNDKLINVLIEAFDDKKYKKTCKEKLNISYLPFEGNQSRLGHYYRHLYQSVCYVQEQKYLNFDEKYKYIKILRAQLSNHEQAILFLNSLSAMGSNWNEKGLISKYRLIKNLPEDFFDKDTEINIKEIYPTLIFQWEEKL